MKTLKIKIALSLLVFFVFVVVISCNRNTSPKEHWFEKSQSVFHGVPARAVFALKGKDVKQQSEKQDAAINKVYETINYTFNSYSEASQIGVINKKSNQIKWNITELMADAFSVAMNIYKDSSGAFDVTVWPLKTLWSNAKKSGVPPTEDEMKSAAKQVGMGHITLQNNPNNTHILSRPTGMQMDFGGLVKGMAVDLIMDNLKTDGITDALVQCGGEIRTAGKNQTGDTWGIGVQHPLDMEKLAGTIRPPFDAAISTSGNYRQPIVIGNTTYYHIFDPKTGHPIATDVLGVTVLMKSAHYANAKADGWATAFAVHGPEKGLALAKKLGMDVLYLVKGKGSKIRALMTDGMHRVFSPSDGVIVGD